MRVKTLIMKSTTTTHKRTEINKTKEELHKNMVEQIEQKQHTRICIYDYI